jgi:hypothetical protein
MPLPDLHYEDERSQLETLELIDSPDNRGDETISGGRADLAISAFATSDQAESGRH